MSTWVGIDVGGTFTDVVVYTNDGMDMVTAKVSSTPHDPSVAFMNGLELGLEKADAEPGQITRLVHGSTVGINAFLQRKGARVGVLCTRGFEDTLAIGRAKRKQMYDFRLDYQTPIFLTEPERTVGISTRLNPQGTLTAEASEAEVDEAIEFLVEQQQVESIALNLLFSYTAPGVEEAVAARITEKYPHVYVSRSSAIDPRVREYERLVVTALDAYIRPLVSQYVGSLRKKLSSFGVQADLYMMESHGGIIDAELLEDAAVSVLMSGLAGGAIGAAKVGESLEEANLLSIDMGGTSTDVVLITDGAVALSDEGVIGDFDVRLPSVDVHTVGAGGGSIAELDVSGGLRVGPESAGASPGPVCYGRGGTEPTVTDANLVLGYLPAGQLADGSMSLSPELARTVIRDRIATPTRKTVAEAAWAIHRVAIASMANAARVVSIKRGIDVRDYALFPCGGAGPMHACGIADELGIDTITISPFPGVLAAYGLLAADTVTNVWKSHHSSLEKVALSALKNELTASASNAEAQTRSKAVDANEIATRVSLNMRYVGQSHELDVVVMPDDLTIPDAPVRLRRAFDELHHAKYGQSDELSYCEITGFKIEVIGSRPTPAPRSEAVVSPDADAEWAPFYDADRNDFVDARVIDRAELKAELTGPAIIQQADSTVVVQPGWKATPSEHGSLKVARVPSSRLRVTAHERQALSVEDALVGKSTLQSP